MSTEAIDKARRLLAVALDGLSDLSGAERDTVAIQAVHAMVAAAEILAQGEVGHEVRDLLRSAYYNMGHAGRASLRLRELVEDAP